MVFLESQGVRKNTKVWQVYDVVSETTITTTTTTTGEKRREEGAVTH